MPFAPGMCQSSRISAGRSLRARSSAVVPSFAVTTRKPSRWSVATSTCTIAGSSSATRMVSWPVVTARPVGVALEQTYFFALGGGENLELAAGGARTFAATLDQAIERVVAAERIVVEQREPPGARGHRVVDDPLGRRMPPARLLRILLERVLRVVDYQVCTGEELDVTSIFAVHGGLAVAPRRIRGVRLVIRRVHEH